MEKITTQEVIDWGKQFLEKSEKEITADGLHLFPEAYSKWVEKISTFVTDNNKDTF